LKIDDEYATTFQRDKKSAKRAISGGANEPKAALSYKDRFEKTDEEELRSAHFEEPLIVVEKFRDKETGIFVFLLTDKKNACDNVSVKYKETRMEAYLSEF